MPGRSLQRLLRGGADTVTGALTLLADGRRPVPDCGGQR